VTGVRRIDSQAIRNAGTLAAPHYADSFGLARASTRVPPSSGHGSSFEDAPLALRWFLLAGWRLVLGLRPGPRASRDHVLGWSIVRLSRETIVLGAESRTWGRRSSSSASSPRASSPARSTTSSGAERA
jgi:hypothetical protein